MSRADLHYAVAIDREIYEAGQVDPTLMDPVVRVDGGLSGVVRPFLVLREYQGPQGAYTEWFALRDGTGRELGRSAVRRIELDGEAFENRFSTLMTNVVVDEPDEHELLFFVNDEQVGAVPVFIETGAGGDPRVAAKEAFGKALQKGSILWVSVPQEAHGGSPSGRNGTQPVWHTQPVWYIFDSGKVYLFNGPTEQDVPHLPAAQEVRLIARSKELRSRVSEVRAAVRLIDQDDPLWAKMEQTALTRRLNLPDGVAAGERWRQNCVLVELTPDFGKDRAGGGARPAAASVTSPTTAGEAAPSQPSHEEDIKVEAQVDQAVYEKLLAEGKPERVARAKAKAAFVRAEKERLRAERSSVGA